MGNDIQPNVPTDQKYEFTIGDASMMAAKIGVLADSVRLRIISLLANVPELTVEAIVSTMGFELDQDISNHLAFLVEEGFLNLSSEGAYSVNIDEIHKVGQFINQFLIGMASYFENLDDLLLITKRLTDLLQDIQKEE